MHHNDARRTFPCPRPHGGDLIYYRDNYRTTAAAKKLSKWIKSLRSRGAFSSRLHHVCYLGQRGSECPA